MLSSIIRIFGFLNNQMFVLGIVICLFLCGRSYAVILEEVMPERPNVLLLISDDDSYPCKSDYVSRWIDKLSIKEFSDFGLVFKNASRAAPLRTALCLGVFTRDKLAQSSFCNIQRIGGADFISLGWGNFNIVDEILKPSEFEPISPKGGFA